MVAFLAGFLGRGGSREVRRVAARSTRLQQGRVGGSNAGRVTGKGRQ